MFRFTFLNVTLSWAVDATSGASTVRLHWWLCHSESGKETEPAVCYIDRQEARQLSVLGEQ